MKGRLEIVRKLLKLEGWVILLSREKSDLEFPLFAVIILE